jgi:hypothetical protein
MRSPYTSRKPHIDINSYANLLKEARIEIEGCTGSMHHHKFPTMRSFASSGNSRVAKCGKLLRLPLGANIR